MNAKVSEAGLLAGAVVWLLAGMLAFSSLKADEFPEFNRDPAQARIVTEDLDRFWAAWDLAEQEPDRRRDIFQKEYLDAGSPGLQAFVELRIQDVDRLLATIDHHADYYAALRAQMPDVLALAEPVREGFFKLQMLLPEAVFPDTYLLIGAMNSAGTIHWEGLLIGVEMHGLTPETNVEAMSEWHRSVLKPMDVIPVIIMHELMHFQQANLSRTAFDTLLGKSIHEGAADFLAELILDRHVNQRLHDWALPREAELWAEFEQVMHDEDHSEWLYNGTQAVNRPADLGYFIGYRIVQAYYGQADNKQEAVREIVAMTDPEAVLEASGYGPVRDGAN